MHIHILPVRSLALLLCTLTLAPPVQIFPQPSFAFRWKDAVNTCLTLAAACTYHKQKLVQVLGYAELVFMAKLVSPVLVETGILERVLCEHSRDEIEYPKHHEEDADHIHSHNPTTIGKIQEPEEQGASIGRSAAVCKASEHCKHGPGHCGEKDALMLNKVTHCCLATVPVGRLVTRKAIIKVLTYHYREHIYDEEEEYKGPK
mmetsp:Transcript_48604/g.104141  ORF Transcript_48604/g.104141 Transcript_48604/m.104141 type:complete len:203 (+) Transcript_48604:393-1001(+)